MQGMMKNKPGPTAPPFLSLQASHVNIRTHCLLWSHKSPSKSEYDGSLILGNNPDAEKDRDWEGEDDENDGEGHQQDRATVRGGLCLLILTDSHDLRRKW